VELGSPSGALAVTDQAALTRVLSEFARLLVRDYEVSDALQDLVDGVTEVLGISGAGVSLLEGERLRFATAASDAVAVLERIQEEGQSGPCVEAHESGQPVLVADLREQSERWPALNQGAAEVGMRAVAGIPMRLNGTRVGALNLYNDQAHEWSDEEIGASRVLADLATGYVANASRVDRLQHTAEQLQVALDSRLIIEQAKGLLAGERSISMEQAFSILRGHARSHNASLRAVADAVVNLHLRP
jgi:GAF domain-containing protein